MPGVPAIYLHSLLGSRSWPEGVSGPTDRRRDQPPEARRSTADGPDGLRVSDLLDPETLRGMVHGPYLRLLRIRRATPAFHPRAPATVLDLDPRVFAIERWTIDDEQRDRRAAQRLARRGDGEAPGRRWRDLITGERVMSEMQLAGYRVAWLVER